MDACQFQDQIKMLQSNTLFQAFNLIRTVFKKRIVKWSIDPGKMVALLFFVHPCLNAPLGNLSQGYEFVQVFEKFWIIIRLFDPSYK